MERSLTIGNYQVSQKRNAWNCVGIGDAAGRAFSLRENETGSWFLNLPNSTFKDGRDRRRVQADTLESAIEFVDERFFGGERHFRGTPQISAIFNAWAATLLVKEATKKDDYEPRVKQFVKWTDKRKIRHWGELRPFHLEEYVRECVDAGNTRSSINNKCRVVRRASEFAVKNFPELNFQILEYKLPKSQTKKTKVNRTTLDFEKAFSFMEFIRRKPNGWNILPGVALEFFASVRHQEMRQLRWNHFEFESGSLVIPDIKNDDSYRVIPLPHLVKDILLESARKRGGVKPNERILITWEKDSFRNSWNRYQKGFEADLKMPPIGMRRTLLQEFIRRDMHSIWVDIYRGRKPDYISAVDWICYLDKMEFDPEGVRKILQEKVVQPLNEWLEEYREIWNQSPSNVVPISA